ncbi:hypothetical protein ACLBPJ_29595, partial [Klebsiella pneumoniae]
CAAGQSIGAIPAISPGGGCALPGLRGIQAIFASQARQVLRRRAIYRRRTRHFAGWRLRLTRPRGSCGLSLIYPLARLKLPVLAASKSLR